MSKISNGTILDLAGVTPGGPTVLYRAVVQTFAAWMETTRDAVKLWCKCLPHGWRRPATL